MLESESQYRLIRNVIPSTELYLGAYTNKDVGERAGSLPLGVPVCHELPVPVPALLCLRRQLKVPGAIRRV